MAKAKTIPAKCIYKGCKQKAIGSYSVDSDIKPAYYCKKHKSDVSASILWAIIGVVELSDQALGFTTKKKKK